MLSAAAAFVKWRGIKDDGVMEKPVKPLVICGINAVAEKLKSAPDDVVELLIADGRDRARVRPLADEARRRGVAVRVVSPQELGALTGGTAHQGVAAAVAPYNYLSLDELLAETKGRAIRVLVLDGITDPQNFGALLRSAEGAGLRHIVIAKDRAAGVTAAVVKSSAGAVNHLKIYRVTNIARALEELKKHGFWVVGLDAEARETIYDRDYPPALAVVLGSEAKGMRPLIQRECDFLASIPMSGRVASLNVSVAAGVFLYELARQLRGSPESRPKNPENSAK
jgi:23S rRNA (guanosine2251-2'-O)-methyltransferase